VEEIGHLEFDWNVLFLVAPSQWCEWLPAHFIFLSSAFSNPDCSPVIVGADPDAVSVFWYCFG
jgi:hypothetical protein